MKIEIAPDFSCNDWDKLKTNLDPQGDWTASSKDWERAIKVFENRIRTRFLETAHRLQNTAYAGPKLPDFEPRNAWSLHNAFTTVAKAMPISTRLPAIQAVGKLFGMTTEGEGTEGSSFTT